MEVEPPSNTEFEEDKIKNQESETITEINGNKDDSTDIDDIDVKLSETVKDKAKVNDNDTDKPAEVSEILDNTNNDSVNTPSEINGNDTSEHVNTSDTKPADESVKMDTEEDADVKEEVKDEPMDQDADPEPELPPFEPQDKSVKLEEPLFEEEIVDGFAFCAFDKYTVLEVRIQQFLLKG